MVLRFLAKRSVLLVLLLPLWLSSKIQSCPPCRHRLQGGPPSSAGKQRIFKRRQTVHARDPRVVLDLPSGPTSPAPFPFPLTPALGVPPAEEESAWPLSLAALGCLAPAWGGPLEGRLWAAPPG